MPPNGLGQIAPFLVTHVTRGRTNQSRHRVLFHVFTHIHPNHILLVVKEELRQGSRQFRLTHAGGPQKDKGPDGPVGVLKPGTGTAHRVGHGIDGLQLAHDPP